MNERTDMLVVHQHVPSNRNRHGHLERTVNLVNAANFAHDDSHTP